MYFRSRPHPALADHVNYYWHVSDAPKQERVHIVPSGTLEIVVNLHDDEIRIHDPSDPTRLTRYSGAVVSGAQGRYFVIDVPAHASIVGVHFRPGGAYAFLDGSAGTLSDAHANLQAIWGARANEVREHLAAVNDPQARFRILDDELLRRLQSAARPREEVRFALRRLITSNARVERVAADIDLSHRRLIDIFATEVGVTPKVFSRVRRFQRALTLAKQGAPPDWTQLALRCGYYDQPHLIRDFVSLSGLPPKELLRRSAGMQGHHAVLAGQRG